jgi:glycine/D-amino acid oxidase-like deaminating enzyme/nitrite reductase/ring-hydroxylating ferredoxin subunit
MGIAVPARTALEANARADVCIVGAGVAGLSTAYVLASEGRSVIVLDDGSIGAGMTARTTAHLSNALDNRYFQIERTHGTHGARFAAQSHTSAIDWIETIATQERIVCEFERLDGYLFTPSGASSEVIDLELAATRRAGLRGVEALARAPLAPFPTGRCLRFPRQAQVHPLKYLTGLAAAFERHGGRIHTGTRVVGVEDGASVRVLASRGYAVTADAAVIATNTPINDRIAIHTKQAPYSTYAIAARVPAASVARALYWDTEDPYHYVRLAHADDAGHELLIAGGEDHKSGQADDGPERLQRLEAWTRERFPMIDKIEFRWSGQVLETADGVAFIGRNPGDENVYVATGDSGMGMTHGTIAGLVIRDLILGRESPWAKLYDPSRGMLRTPVEYAKENLNVAAQYLEGYLGGGDVASANDIPPERGAVLRRKFAKVAAYRDEHGVLHEYSAVCPHLGCVVHWNVVEKTWDCPCHGSRFDRHGEVIVGPAKVNLKPRGTNLEP